MAPGLDFLKLLLLKVLLLPLLIYVSFIDHAFSCESKLLGSIPIATDAATSQIYAQYDNFFQLIVKNEQKIKLEEIEIKYSDNELDGLAVTDTQTGAITIPKFLTHSYFLPLIHIHEVQHALDIQSEYVGKIPPSIHSAKMPFFTDKDLTKKLIKLEARAYDNMYFLLRNIYPSWLVKKMAYGDHSRRLTSLQNILEGYLSSNDRRSFVATSVHIHSGNKVPPDFINKVLDEVGIL